MGVTTKFDCYQCEDCGIDFQLTCEQENEDEHFVIGADGMIYSRSISCPYCGGNALFQGILEWQILSGDSTSVY